MNCPSRAGRVVNVFHAEQTDLMVVNGGNNVIRSTRRWLARPPWR